MFIKLLKKIIFLESYAIQRDFVYHFNKKILMKLCNYENEEDYKRDFNILKDKGLINIIYKKSVVDGKWSSNIESYKVINERIKKINERIKQEGKSDLWRSFKEIYNRLHCKFDKKKFKVYYGTKIKTLLDMKCKVAIWKKNWEAKANKEQENKKSFTTNNKKQMKEAKKQYFKIDNNKQLKDMNKEEAVQFLKSKEDKAESGLAKDIISFFSKRVAEKFNVSNENIENENINNENNRNENNNYFRINENIENDNVRNDNLPNNENNENENNEKDLYNEYVNRINLINEKVGRLMEWERSTGFYYFSDKKIYIKDMLEFINNYNK